MKTLLPVPEITIGNGAVDSLGAAVAGLPGAPNRVLLVIDPFLAAAGVTGRVLAALAARDLAVTLFDGLSGEPGVHQIDTAAALAWRDGAEAVVGVGGGSALDVAKFAAAIAPSGGGAQRYQFCEKPLPANGLPAICVPTTAGTGSEATLTVVFANAEGKKVWAWGPELAARKAVLDPGLTVSLPPGLTAATGIDALVHAIEACTNANRFAANDLTAHAAIRLVARHLRQAVRQPDDLEAREGMLLASCLAGIAINNAGTAIAHNIAHALGTLGRIHHGRAAGLGLRASLPWSIAANTDAFAAAAEALGGPREADALPVLFDRLLREVGLKVAVADELPGIGAERLAEEMAQPENEAMRRSSARPSEDKDLLHLARAVLAAD
ncbi:MAG: iron-containing alcohol dehydrogenase [Thalassobaculales bacterium]